MDETNGPTPNLAVFCDYENVAIGARENGAGELRVDLILERLLDKGNVVVKKAYADWNRFKSAKRPLHQASFELIEIPHVSYSGKNSADIRLVVDALDLCYTKAHVGVFAIISGDSDFSPLVSKLRENDKKVLGVGVKSSTSDLLVDNCDEFIYYDDLIHRGRRKGTKGDEALELVLDTADALFADRDGQLWGSMVKQALKRKRPNFSERTYGYRSFNQLLEEAAARKLIEIEADDRSGGYIIRGLPGAE